MPRLHLSALSPEQLLDAALSERTEIVARPRPTPREVLAAWLGNFGVGIGGGIAAGVALYVAGESALIEYEAQVLSEDALQAQCLSVYKPHVAKGGGVGFWVR